ncbi:MAG: hypothetical protein ABIV43_00225, partial [Candidatus Saccharimonadales bacterium]
MNMVLSVLQTGLLTFFAALPASSPQTNSYGLQSYGFGSGGVVNSKTTTYSLDGITGEISGRPQTSTGNTSNLKSGYVESRQANLPKLLSSDNASGIYYNKLHFVVDTQGNPSDAKYLITVSLSSSVDTNNNFTGGNQYLMPDGTLSSTLSLSAYQTYAALGGSGGGLIIGLDQNTHYFIHLKATQCAYTESGYGPVTDQQTASATLSFSLETSTNPTPPFTIALGTLAAGNVTTSAQTINTTLTTNGASGGDVYISGQNGGLRSPSTAYKINAVSTDLASAAEGFGARNNSVGQTSCSTYSVVAPYNVSGTNVGIVDSTTRSLYTSS